MKNNEALTAILIGAGLILASLIAVGGMFMWIKFAGNTMTGMGIAEMLAFIVAPAAILATGLGLILVLGGGLVIVWRNVAKRVRSR